MNKFIIKLVIFLLPILCVIVTLEYFIRNHHTVMKQKQMYLSEKGDSIEVLILGNSHAGDGLNPVLFKLNTFNVASGSQSLYFDIEITKKYLTEMTQLKYVLISIDYHSLYFTYSAQRHFMYSHYYGIDYKNYYSLKSRISVLFYGFGLKESLVLLSEKPITATKGWTGGYQTTNYNSLNRLTGEKRVDVFNKMIIENFYQKNDILSQLKDFIELLKSKGITPIIITLPCHKYYNDYLNIEIVSQNKVDVTGICKQYDIEYLNYLYEELPDEYFYNVDHLNKKGASVISKKISHEILMLERTLSKSKKIEN